MYLSENRCKMKCTYIHVFLSSHNYKEDVYLYTIIRKILSIYKHNYVYLKVGNWNLDSVDDCKQNCVN